MIISGKSTGKKIFLILEDYDGVCLKIFQLQEQILKKAFLAEFSVFFDKFVT